MTIDETISASSNFDAILDQRSAICLRRTEICPVKISHGQHIKAATYINRLISCNVIDCRDAIRVTQRWRYIEGLAQP